MMVLVNQLKLDREVENHSEETRSHSEGNSL
jgi:hypothetical protein